MAKVMSGIRVLEVANFVFVPTTGGVLADWGADVIKVEHPVRGDANRGVLRLQNVVIDRQRNPLIQQSSRGKRSIGIDLTTAEGVELLYELAKSCDVFLTNLLPAARQKLKVDVEHLRAVNPSIIYARGSALGDKGPERLNGGYDATAFWARSGTALLVAPPEINGPLLQPGPGYGDTISATNLAGGVAAALLHRERTGEALEVDVSLLSSAVWTVSLSTDIAMETGCNDIVATMPGTPQANPFTSIYETGSGEFIILYIVVPGPIIADTFEHLDLPELAKDPRFSTVNALFANAEAAHALIAEAIKAQPLSYWKERLRTMKGQWAIYQTILDAETDPQVLANDMIFEVEAPDGGRPLKLVASPVQFDHTPIAPDRAPELGEHTEQILQEAGIDWERIIALKDAGVVN